VRTAISSPLQALTTLLVLVMVMTLSSAAVSIAYAAGRHSQSTVHRSGAQAGLGGTGHILVVLTRR
jgi:hypothetical protein